MLSWMFHQQVAELTYDVVTEMPFWELFAPPFERDSEAWQATLEV